MQQRKKPAGRAANLGDWLHPAKKDGGGVSSKMTPSEPAPMPKKRRPKK